MSCVLLFFCLSFSFLAMALSVCFRFMSLTVPLVSFVPLLKLMGEFFDYFFLCPRHTVPIFIYDGHPNAKIVSSYEVGPDLVKIPKSDRSKYDE